MRVRNPSLLSSRAHLRSSDHFTFTGVTAKEMPTPQKKGEKKSQVDCGEIPARGRFLKSRAPDNFTGKMECRK